MNIFEKIFLSRKTRQLIEQKSIAGPRFALGPNGLYVGPPDNQESYITNGYQLNDIVYSAIQLILDKITVAPWGLYKVEDEEELKRYRAIMATKNISPKDYRQARDSRKKSLKPIENYGLQEGRLKELLTYPNEAETWTSFIIGGMLYKLLTGNKYVWGDPLKGGANMGLPSFLYNLPSDQVTLKIDNTFPAKVTGYEITGIGQKFDKSTVLHEKYANPKWDVMGGNLYGMSPLKAALQGVISRNNSAATATAAQYKNRGLDQVLYLDDPAERTSQDGVAMMENLKLKLKNEYTGVYNYGKIATSPYKVGALSLGLSAKDMQIIEAEKWDLVRIYNIFGVPPALGSTEVMTMDNIKVAERSLTTRCALPEMTVFRDMLNWKLKTDWGFKGKNIYVDFDMTVYSELGSDMNDVANWISKVSQVFTPNEIREQLGYEGIEAPEFDEPWITPQMGQPLNEWVMNPVDNALNYEQDNGQSDEGISGNGTGAKVQDGKRTAATS